jgi:uncharacterized protein
MDLKSRLRRLERSAPRIAAPEEPSSASPVGELRRRLDRLLGPGRVVSGAELEHAPRRNRGEALRELLGGNEVAAPSGAAFAVDRVFAPGLRHGRLPIAELGGLPCDGARILFPEFLGGGLQPSEIAYVDTETTGLAGGAGTVPFLLGVGRWSPEGFWVRQLFLEDLDREAPLLEAFGRALEGVRCVVTYNGGPFDVPILENRHVLQRTPWPLSGVPHLDLLPSSRTLWRSRHPDCRLVTLERSVLGFARQGDVPSSEIPGIYARYLRRGPDGALGTVFSHNRWDLVSLAGLLWAAGRAGAGLEELSAAGVGLLHARRGRRAQARAPLEEGLEGELPPEVRLRALRELSLACKEEGDWRGALEAWSELRRLRPCGDPFPVVEAAKVLEHRLKDFRGALGLVESALQAGTWIPRDRENLEKRRRRLLGRVATAPVTLRSGSDPDPPGGE